MESFCAKPPNKKGHDKGCIRLSASENATDFTETWRCTPSCPLASSAISAMMDKKEKQPADVLDRVLEIFEEQEKTAKKEAEPEKPSRERPAWATMPKPFGGGK